MWAVVVTDLFNGPFWFGAAPHKRKYIIKFAFKVLRSTNSIEVLNVIWAGVRDDDPTASIEAIGFEVCTQ